MSRTLIIGLVLVGSSQASRAEAQTRDVVGTVRDAWTERPIANAEVSVVGEEGWVCTNDRGEYRLSTRTGAVSLIARSGESIGRPRMLTATDNVGPLHVDPQISLAMKQIGERKAIGGWVFAQLSAAPEIEIFRGRYYVDGVELIVRPSHCGPATPSRRGAAPS